MAFILFISFIILLRIGELLLSKRNEKWLLQNGAIEYGSSHYPFIVALHILFIISLIVEYSAQQTVSFSFFFIAVYFLLLACLKPGLSYRWGNFGTPESIIFRMLR